MFKITVEGIFESLTGAGASKYENFNLTFVSSRVQKEGIETHIQKRYIPYLLKTDKTYKNKMFSNLKNYRIVSIEKLEEETELFGKDILKLDEFEIQDLACLYDLYEVPLNGVYPLNETREKTALAYLKKVLKVPMKTPTEKKKLKFLEQKTDGSFVPNFQGREILIEKDEEFFKKANKKEIQKFDLDDFSLANKQKNKLEEKQNVQEENENDDFTNINLNDLV